MLLEEFFSLPEEQQKELVIQYRVRQNIISQAEYIKKELDLLNKSYKELQNRCTHTMKSSSYQTDTDECGRMLDSGTYTYHCPDCDKQWFEHV